LKIVVFEGAESVWPKISGRSGRPRPTILRVRIDLSYGVRMLSEISFVLSQFTLLTDIWTNRQTKGFATAKPAC